jgi:hypothetical protein
MSFQTKIFNKLCSSKSYIPSIYPDKKKIYVLGDIHGDYELAIKLLSLTKCISICDKHKTINWVGGSAFIVQVGDQVDRCRPNLESIPPIMCDNPAATVNDEASDIKILKLFTYLHEQAVKYGGAVISLFGNHEFMNVHGVTTYTSYKGIREFDNYVDPVTKQVFKDGQEGRKHAFQPGNELGKFLGCTRVGILVIGKYMFAHAGIINDFLTQYNITDINDIDKINNALRGWLLNIMENKDISTMELLTMHPDSFTWTRKLGTIPPGTSMAHNICKTQLLPVLDKLNIEYLFIGHTPQCSGINSTCGNRLIRTDIGSSRAFENFVNNMGSRIPQVLKIKKNIMSIIS